MAEYPKPIEIKHLFEVYIPTKCRCGQDLPTAERNKVFQEIKNNFTQWFGGGTLITDHLKMKGFWGTTDEDGDIIYSNANAAQFKEYREDVLKLTADLANALSQEAAACRIDQKMFLFPSTDKTCLHERKPGSQLKPSTTEYMALRPIDRYRSIQAGLQRLKSLEKARELFCQILHYPYTSSMFPVFSWPDELKNMIADGSTPEIIAEQNKFKVIYIKLTDSRLLRAHERKIIDRIIKDDLLMRGLLIVSDRECQNWEFINVKYAKAKNKFIIRRMRINQQEQMRTIVERLDKIDIEQIGEQAGADEIQKLHDQAFDVQAVTREFFKQYRLVFDKVESMIKGIKNKDDKRLFTQQLFNRLMFISFIQKKNWLKINERTDYLNELWFDYRAAKDRKSNFYQDRLVPLFFEGLNNEKMKPFFRKNIGEGPYLNGGLFDENESDRNPKITVPDVCVETILTELFDCFNFTVTESPPFDQEVAIDPEMLGHVFEELVTGRHETGSFYTPKTIVSFMCRESLKRHLKTTVPKESEQAIDEFVENHDATALRVPGLIFESLKDIRICDPACGSGAYLLGMMHELSDLRVCLFTSKNIGSAVAYERKLEIIQNNIYGVDIDSFAVNIARLRLWLSLIIEFDGVTPPPLPNLDFKIECGDSLTAAGFEQNTSLFQHPATIQAKVIFQLKQKALIGSTKDKLKKATFLLTKNPK